MDDRLSFGRWCSLALLAASTSASASIREPTVTAASVLSDATLPSNRCRALLEQSRGSSISPSFVIFSRGQTTNFCPRKNQHWPGPVISIVKDKKGQQSALEFWTRSETDDGIVENPIKRNKVRLADNDGADDETHDNHPLQIGELELNVENNITSNTSDISTEINQSQIMTGVNTTCNLTENKTKLQEITISIDSSFAQNNTSPWKRILSMPVVGPLLPGKPLFMRRLMPISSGEIISKIIEETPVQSDLQMEIEEIVMLRRGDELDQGEEDPETTQSSNMSRWMRLSLPALLPGKPLFMRRLMPISSSEIISKIMEETPAQNDLQMELEEVVMLKQMEDSETTQNSLGWRMRLSSMTALLPRKLTFMRQLMLIRRDETISKVNGERSLQSDAKIEADELTLVKKSDTHGLDQEDKGSGTTPHNYEGGRQQSTEIEGPKSPDLLNETGNDTNQTSYIDLPELPATEPVSVQNPKKNKRRNFFWRRPKEANDENKGALITKEELECPRIATNIHELQKAVLIDGIPLRDVGFRFPVKGIGSDIILGRGNSDSTPSENTTTHLSFDNETVFLRDDPAINGSLSSLTCDAESPSYQRGIELMGLHPVLSVVRERVKAKSKPGDRLQDTTSPEDIPHLALVIEGGGMRGSVSAGMAAALTTLDLLDAFDSIHGSSAGAIVGAYIVSRQLCTDIYTDILPASGNQFASKSRGAINFGVDWLGDVIQRKLLTGSLEEEPDEDQASDGLCFAEELEYENSTSWCGEDYFSSVELAMGRRNDKQLKSSLPSHGPALNWSDDRFSPVYESANYLVSNTFSVAKSSVFGFRPLGRALRPAFAALDFASAMSQYLRNRPGMNLTYILDGIMDETHGLRPFDMNAFRANDKRQPLYVVASTVNRGGKGDMETVAFNSKDGDFFGSNFQENSADATLDTERQSWYKRLWILFKFVPYSIFKTVGKAFFDTGKERNVLFEKSLKDKLEAEFLPPGSKAMMGFASRHKIRELRRPQEEKVYEPTGPINGEGKDGIYSCLEASMNVPGAAGPPTHLIRSLNRKFIEPRSRFAIFRSRIELNRRKESNSHLCFDAFCYDPIPYRSAVEVANATHVLALRSRPDGCVVETRQHMYERAVGPIYFRKHGMNQVAKLFSSGGSQYRYIEDVLTLNEGLTQGIAMGKNDTQGGHPKGVKIPPSKLLYGNDMAELLDTTDNWKRAHLLPINLPFGAPELPTLSLDKNEVLRAVRHGYATAFDIFAPIAGLSFDPSIIKGEKVAELLFPDVDDIEIANKKVKVKPSYISEDEEETKRRSFADWIGRKREAKRKAKDEITLHPDGSLARRIQRRTSSFHETDQYVRDDGNTLEYIETEALLASLPGFRGGRLDHIADNLLANEERKKKGVFGD